MIYDYLILGGGITGVAAGRVLQQKFPDKKFLILESEDSPGGLLRTKVINGHYLDIGGGHVLHSKYPEVLEWIFSHIPKEDFIEITTNIVLNLEGHIINFPIELNLWQLPTNLQLEYLISYIEAASKNSKYTSFEDWIKNYLGNKIADNYMIPYNKKLWCIDIDELNTEWLSKIPKTDIPKILKTIIEKKANFNVDITSHAKIYYPKYGGFQAIFDAISKSVNDNIITNTKVEKLKYSDGIWTVNDKYSSRKIINTIPWPILKIEGLPEFDFEKEFKNLKTLSNVMSLWEREPYHHDYHWMYIPDMKVEQHREFYIKNLAPYSKDGGVATDINYYRWKELGGKWAAGTPLYEHVNMWAYPIPTKTYKESIQRILNFTKQYGLVGLGRWGQWSYFNTDHCIKQVLEFFDSPDNFDFFNKEWFKN